MFAKHFDCGIPGFNGISGLLKKEIINQFRIDGYQENIYKYF